jgi:hypothetical protein
LAPTRKRGKYVAVLVFTIIPFCPSVLWGQLLPHTLAGDTAVRSSVHGTLSDSLAPFSFTSRHLAPTPEVSRGSRSLLRSILWVAF